MIHVGNLTAAHGFLVKFFTHFYCLFNSILQLKQDQQQDACNGTEKLVQIGIYYQINNPDFMVNGVKNSSEM